MNRRLVMDHFSPAVWLRSLSMLLLCSLVGTVSARESLVILPSNLVLNGPTTRQSLIVEQLAGHDFIGQLTNTPEYSVANTNIVRLEGNLALPVSNGKTTVKIRLGKAVVTAPITVTGMDKPAEWSFRNHVQPVLAKYGCSSGACHGAAAGQNGFRLSLRGYDDEGDFLSLTRNALGRRITPDDPGRSLLLLKPTGAVPHKGGKKFDTNSIEYRVLSEWIAAGTPGPKASDARIDRIEILPAKVILKPGQSQQMSVRAYFNDGHYEDVTRWVKYTDSNSSVTSSDENGLVKIMGNGEGAITAWYLSRIAIATVSVPYPNAISPQVFARVPSRNFIDELVNEKLRDLNLPPSPRCSDADFIRRSFIDTLGILPTAEETTAFLADKSSKKRDKLIEALLRRPEFVDYWTYKWSDLLLVNSKQLKPNAMWAYYRWIRDQVARNTPWDVFAKELITAQGSTLENGAANFFVLHDDPKALSENMSLAFLGMSINCARCHNHPLEKWTNNDYYAMANLFARVNAKNGAVDGDRIIFASAHGDLVQPLTGKPQRPRPLDGTPLPANDTGDRRVELAEWLTSRDNPYFTRAIVNRIWANFYSVGLVMSVDDLRVTNPSSNPKLFAAAAKYLADQKFDLQSLMRVILQSETYQRSSVPLAENAADTRFYSRYYPRRLMAEVMLDAFSQVTKAPTTFKGYPVGWRALQLPDATVDSYFLQSFGRPERAVTCECERTANPSVTQVLHIANGDTLNAKLEMKGNRIDQLLKQDKAPEALVDDIYLTALSRHPSDTEKQRLVTVLQKASKEEQRATVEDLCWAILSSKEFLFNH